MDEWSSSLGHAAVYGFLEPQSIHNAQDRRVECQQYIDAGSSGLRIIKKGGLN